MYGIYVYGESNLNKISRIWLRINDNLLVTDVRQWTLNV
jgi:hypothetical protein